MSVKGQLRSCSDFLMVAMKAAERGNSKSGMTLVRACMDNMELLVRQSENVKAGDADPQALLNKAAAELQAELGPGNGIVSALRNAIERLHALRAELNPPKPSPKN